MIVTGLVAGHAGGWLGRWWMWTSLVVLVGLWAAMYRWGGGYFGLVQAAAERAVEERATSPGSTTELDAYRATRLGWQPVGMMVLGIGGLTAILSLMLLKPF